MKDFKEESIAHWNYTKKIIQLCLGEHSRMLDLMEYLYIQAMIHGFKHGFKHGLEVTHEGS